jgi:hypothetical protein
VQRRIRVAGWGLVAAGIAAIAVIVTAGAFGAHGDTAFNLWIGWATVAAVPLAALGVLLVVLDKLVKPDAADEGRVKDIENQLAAVVLAQAQDARSRLIGTGAPGDTAANVRFVKFTSTEVVYGVTGSGVTELPDYDVSP